MTVDDARLKEIEAELARLFPELRQLGRLRLLDIGFGSVVVESKNEVIFRIGRTQATGVAHEKEWDLLRALKGHVSLPIPYPLWKVPAGSSHFPYGAMGYTKLPGEPLSSDALHDERTERIATEIGRFLAELHAFPVSRAAELKIPGVGTRKAEWEELFADVLPALKVLLRRDEYEVIRVWSDDFLGDEELRQYRPALVHRDVWYENVLVDRDSASVTGILDFGDARIGDPAEDFAPQLYFGLAFVEAVLDGYRAAGGSWDDASGHRLMRYWEARDLGGLRFGLVNDLPDEVEDALRKIRSGPILSEVT